MEPEPKEIFAAPRSWSRKKSFRLRITAYYLGGVPGVLKDGHGGGEVVLAELTVLVHHQVDPVPPSREDVVLQRGRPKLK
jgi:hypothetical protein